MATLKEQADAILLEKQTDILPENIKAGVQIFDVVGTMSAGINTNDATATSSDIVAGQTAYVNGEKITGSMEGIYSADYNATGIWSATDTDGDEAIGVAYNNVTERFYIEKEGGIGIFAKKSQIAELEGLTSDKLLSGNTILGIEGTATSGEGSGSVVFSDGVKLFETQSKMQADTDPQEGDLAVVYREDISNWNGSSPITSFTFPKTVILSSAQTGSCYGYASGNAYVDINGSVNSTSASFSIYGNSSYSIRYTSTDGLTYTRTDTYDETIIVSDEPVTINMYEWSDVCSNFMLTGGNIFEGLYEYTLGHVNKDYIKIPYLTDVSYTLNGTSISESSITTSSDCPTFKLSDIYSLLNKYKSDGHTFDDMMIYLSDDNELYLIDDHSIYTFNYITFDPNNNYLGISYSTTGATTLGDPQYYINIVHLDIANQTYNIEKTIQGTDIKNYSYSGTSSRLLLSSTLLNNTKYLPMQIYSTSVNTYCYLYICTTSSSSTKYGNKSITFTPYKIEDTYLPASSQLTLKKEYQLLPGVKAYGSTGVIEGDGTIYANLDWSPDILKNIPTEVFLAYNKVPLKAYSSAIASKVQVNEPNFIYGLKNNTESSENIMMSIDNTEVKEYAASIPEEESFSGTGLYGGCFYDNKMVYGYIRTSGSKNYVYIIYYDFKTKTYEHKLLDSEATNLNTIVNFVTDEKDGNLCMCVNMIHDTYKYSKFNSAIYKIYPDGTSTRIFYNSFNSIDSDIATSTSSSSLYSSGVVVYDNAVFLGYNRYVSSKMYVRLAMIKDEVKTNIIAYTATDLDYIPRFNSWFSRQRSWVDSANLYFLSHDNSNTYLSKLDMSTGTLTNLQTLSFGYYKQNRAYNSSGFYKNGDNLYICISYATTSNSSSSSNSYNVQIFKYDIVNNTIADLGNGSHGGNRGDEGGRIIPIVEGNTLYFRCSHKTVIINMETDTMTISTEAKIFPASLYYPYYKNGIMYAWGNNPGIIMSNKQFDKGNLNGLLFTSNTDSKFILYNLDMDNN